MSQSSILQEISPSLWMRLFAKVTEHFVFRDQLSKEDLGETPSVLCNRNPLGAPYYLSRIDAQVLLYEQFPVHVRQAIVEAGQEYNRPDKGPCKENKDNLALQILGLVVKQYWHNDEDRGAVYECCQHTILGSVVISFIENLNVMSDAKIHAMYSARDELHELMMRAMSGISTEGPKIILPH